jgi:hypothetical protein
MPTRTWGCLNRSCYPFEFDSVEKDPECPKCGGPTKWVPGKTNIIRPMSGGTKSKLKYANEIVQGLIDKHNQNVELPGLKLGDITKPAVQPQPSSTASWNFPDARGKRWPVSVPISKHGVPYGCVPVPGMTEKVVFAPDLKRGTDKPPIPE